MDVPSKVAAVFIGVGVTICGTAITAEAFRQADEVQFRDVSIPDRPCRTEQGPAPCFWDAGVRGDGNGHSFWLLRDGKPLDENKVRAEYLDHRVEGAPRDQEPYGGCDEAYLYPKSVGARWCRHHGFNAEGSYSDGWVPFMDVEGHKGCEIKVGPTAYVRCEDGFKASS